MKIAILIETLLPGGAELFALRLAKALASSHQVILYNFRADRVNMEIVKVHQKNFEIVSFDLPFGFLIDKFDALLFILRMDFSLRDFFLRRHLKRTIEKYKIQVMHSNQFKVDWNTSLVNKKFKLRHVITIHGDYLKFFKMLNKGTAQLIHHYKAKLNQIVENIDHIVCISDQQIDFFKKVIKAEYYNKIQKIYNGYNISGNIKYKSREEIGINPNVFVFGMVARGIPEKGWEIAIRAFLNCAENNKSIFLILVGDGDYMTTLKNQYRHQSILFAGFSPQPLEWIKVFDVGLLPTYYASESLPTSIIEYMAAGKPCIASKKGEIGQMITDNGQMAGYLFDIDPLENAENKLADLMNMIVKNKETTLPELSRMSEKMFEKFDMNNCLNKYQRLYESN
jgi:L-malate glycosyltransferase